MRRIICAAIEYYGVIVCGPRHFDATMKKVVNELHWKVPSSKWQQGFIDQFGEFHNRREAMVIAIAAGQNIDYKRNGGDNRKLYSEGLY